MINFDQIRINYPFGSLTGTETFIAQQDGLTKGGFLSVLKEWMFVDFVAAGITDATTVGKNILTAANADDVMTAIGLSEPSPANVVNQSETEYRFLWSPKDVHDAISSREVKVPVEITVTGDAALSWVGRKVIARHGATSITQTLPVTEDPVTFTAGMEFTIINLGGSVVVVDGSDGIIEDSVGTATSITIPVNEKAVFVCTADNTWFVSR